MPENPKDNATEKPQKGLFIVGSGRSGTTLLRLILDSHPEIAVSDESQFLSTFIHYRNLKIDYTDPAVRRALLKNIHGFVSALYAKDPNYFWTRFFQNNIDVLAEKSRDFDTLIQEIYYRFHSESGKTIWGDNTPHYINLAQYLKRIFPSAKFIHLIRDGRDVHLSIEKVPWGPNHVYNSALYWKRIIHTGERNKAKWPDDWYDLIYENLLKDPETELQKLCQFIGTSYDPDMINFYKTAEKRLPSTRINSDFQKTKSPIDPRNCEKWKKKMSRKDNCIFESIAGPELRKYGFEVTGDCADAPSAVAAFRYQAQNFIRRLRNLISYPQGGKVVINYRYLRYYQTKLKRKI